MIDIEPCWTSGSDFEHNRYRLRLERAVKVKSEYRIETLVDSDHVVVYGVLGGDAPYAVLADRRGGSLYCSCPDGAHATVFDGVASSLCKHSLACVLKGGDEVVLAPVSDGIVLRLDAGEVEEARIEQLARSVSLAMSGPGEKVLVIAEDQPAAGICALGVREWLGMSLEATLGLLSRSFPRAVLADAHVRYLIENFRPS